MNTMTEVSQTNEHRGPVASILPRLSALRRSLSRMRARVELRWALATNSTDALMRRRLDCWASGGWGESLEKHHSQMAQTIWERIELRPNDRILDLGCGQGWACRLLANRAPRECIVVGVDLSNEMIRQAREKSATFENVVYYCGSADNIPSPDNYFTKIISIEAFYYFPQQERVLQELLRVAERGAELFLLICLFRENADSQPWSSEVGLPLHVRAISEYESMLRRSGWANVTSRVFDLRRDPAAPPAEHDCPLLLTCRKP